ncbi:MAG: tetrapyrrole methylase family protein / MazG family protein [Acidobacteriota bacterium]|jgi:ATP diphosphatase|nr:tetrapyrrole methylase family protein / MazG family protein [Acidobacteriota bacterium]
MSELQKLVDLVARLRAPDGCPWDKEQTLENVRAYLLEEAHELAGAIDGGDWQELMEELGDMLFQVAFITRLAEEAGAFRLPQVIDGVHSKMVARHPHVFGGPGGETLADTEAVRQAWERRKLQEEPGRTTLLGGVPSSLPALLGTYRLTQKAAGVGFDWPDAASVLDKAEEEIAEVREALAEGNAAHVREEIGDLLFTLANLARKLDVDPEAALAGTNRKFRTRFAAVEQGLADKGKTAAEATLEEMDELWEAAKGR